MTSRRLAAGGAIDRTSPLAYRFDGRRLQGYAGDTLASALLANGVRLTGRSFKYHRPRGILTAGPEEPNALVEVGSGARREPNTPATMVELSDGLDARSQNRWPSLQFDLAAVNGFAAPLFGAGFYYKTFMWPGALWERLYEPAIRRAAGLGRARGVADPDHYDLSHAHCDLLVVGAGPAGLAAALEGSRRGGYVAVGSGPGIWLVLAADRGEADPVGGLAATLGGVAAVTDQSGTYAGLRLAGPRVPDLLARGALLDLTADAFPPGRAAATQMAHVPVVLWRGPGDDHFSLLCFRSYADSLWGWLSAAAAEFGFSSRG